jgi:hypothetical protein
MSQASLLGTVALGPAASPLLPHFDIAFKSSERFQLREELFIFWTAKWWTTVEETTFDANSVFDPYLK